jgi:cobalt-zinc-cadmium resistance protein CzcA
MRVISITLFCFLSAKVLGQDTFSLPQAIDYALKANASIKASSYHVDAQKQLKKTSFDLPKTEVSLLYGQYNSYATNDNNLTISQSIPFFALGSQAKLNRSRLASSELKKTLHENELVYRVKETYYQLAYTYAVLRSLQQQDSIFEGFYKASSLRYKAGETNLLEQSTAESQRNEAKNRIRQTDSDITILRSHLQALLNTEVMPDIIKEDFQAITLSLALDTAMLATNPALAYSRQQIDVADAEKKMQAARSAPDLLVGYFNQTLIGAIDPESGALATSRERFSGFQVGLAIPLWIVPHQARTRAAESTRRAAESDYMSNQRTLLAELQQAFQAYEKNKNSLAYYRDTALPNAELILKQAQVAFRNGEIGYAEYLLGLRNATGIREKYLETVNGYNQSIIFIEFLSGNKSN